MKTILELSPTTKTTYTMDDYTYNLVTRIFDNYQLLYHSHPTMTRILSYLPKELSDTVSISTKPADEPLAGHNIHILE